MPRARNSVICPTAPTRRVWVSSIVSTNARRDESGGETTAAAIATLPDDAALQAILTLNGNVLGDRPIKVGRYFAAAIGRRRQTYGRDRGEGNSGCERRRRRRRLLAGHVTARSRWPTVRSAPVGGSWERLRAPRTPSPLWSFFDMTPGARVLVAATSC